MYKMNRFFIAAMVVAILAMGAGQAAATLQVTFGAGGLTTTIVDGGAGDSDTVVNNSIGVVATVVDGYTFQFTLTTANIPGTPTLAFVQQGTNQISGSGATTVSIYANGSDFTMPASPPDVTINSSSTAQFLSPTVAGNTMDHSFNAYYDATNAMSTTATGTLIGSGGPTTITAPGLNNALTDVEVHPFSTTPYALNLELIAVLNNGGLNTIDLDGQVQATPVPEPASLLLLGSGLVGLGYLARRRSRANKA